ncbi:MAG: efflux RND transporter periplasmic adaptor subunit [Thiolinea sp.]
MLMPKRGICLSLMLLSLSGCQPAEEAAIPDPGPRPVKVAAVSTGQGGTEYQYPAVVLPAQIAELSFRIGGQVVELPIHAMDEVKKGDVIAKLDPRDYKSNVDQLRARIVAEESRLKAMTSGSRQEDIAALRAAIVAAQARVSSAKAQAERTLSQYRKGLVVKERLDAELAAVKTAQAQLTSDQQALKRGRTGSRKEDVTTQLAQINSLRTQLKNAQDTAQDAALLAPFDGIIAERLVDNFTNIQPKQPVAVIQNLGRLELSFNIPGPDVARLGARREHLQLEAVLDAVPSKRFAAEVVEFNTRADERTRTFQGRVAIERPEDFNIFPGMVGQVLVTDTSQAGKTLSIPGTAVSADSDDSPVVWVVNAEGAVEKRAVVLGSAARDGAVEVREGLNAGEQVVTAGVSAMMPGLKVRPVTAIGDLR